MGGRGRAAERSQENAWRRILSRSTEERSTGRGRLLKQAQVFNGTPPQLESVVVPSTTRVHQRSREQPLLPYASTFYPSHFATDSASHYSLTRGQPSLLQSSAKLYDPGLSTRPVYASYSGCNLNSEKSRPPAQLTSLAPSVSVA